MAAKLFSAILVLMATSVLAEEGTDPRAEYEAGFEHAKQLADEKNYVEAVKAFNSLARQARDPKVLMELGRCYKALGEDDMAIQAYSMALITPGANLNQGLMLQTYEDRGQLYFASDRFREATDDFAQGIQLDPTNAAMQYWRGLALLNWARTDLKNEGSIPTIEQALKSFDSAIRFKDDYAIAYYERGMAKALLGKTDEAKEDLSRALLTSPDAELARRMADWAVQLQVENQSLQDRVAESEADVDDTNESTELLREIRDLLRLQTGQRQPFALSDRTVEAVEVATKRRLLRERLAQLTRRLDELQLQLIAMEDATPAERESTKVEIQNIERVRNKFVDNLARLEKQVEASVAP